VVGPTGSNAEIVVLDRHRRWRRRQPAAETLPGRRQAARAQRAGPQRLVRAPDEGVDPPSLPPVIAGDADSAPPQLVHRAQVPLCIIRSRSVLSVPRSATTTVVRTTAAAGATGFGGNCPGLPWITGGDLRATSASRAQRSACPAPPAASQPEPRA
jgi:hypothetical protein